MPFSRQFSPVTTRIWVLFKIAISIYLVESKTFTTRMIQIILVPVYLYGFMVAEDTILSR
ncbi:hypothetical protein E4H04_12980 [Candidatus Bathyarchaeota archaeon]|nr:MAG: hypothetical protein E4H04_12980 [Candidatus Bathyarchaeota archaeon]